MEQKTNSNLRLGMTFMASIFFIFGFITNFNIAMKDQVQLAFTLSNFDAQLVNFAFFISYAVFSFLCGYIIKRIGYKNGVIAGLVLVAVGSYMFFPAVSALSYPLFLLAVFVMASGVVFLQTAANPYVAALGPQETAPARLNLTQALNGVATTIAPFLAGVLVLAPAILAIQGGATPADAAKFVQMPFIVIGSLVVLIAVGIAFIKLPEIKGDSTISSSSVFKKPQVWLGALGIFCYVGAEVGTASQIAPYLKDSGFLADAAVKLSAIYWGGAMIGRFFGAISLTHFAKPQNRYGLYALIFAGAYGLAFFLTRDFALSGLFLIFVAINLVGFMLGRNKPNRTLAVLAGAAGLLVALTVASTGHFAIWPIIAVGLFNSIMFPTIFTLAIDDLGPHTSQGSGILCMAIVGGAIIPFAMGMLADHYGVHHAFLMPMLGYLYILYYGVMGYKKSTR